MTVTLLGVPWDGSSSWRRGTAQAPAVVRAAWRRAGVWSNRTTEHGLDLELMGMPADDGDVAVQGTHGMMCTAVEARVQALVDSGRLPLLIGGDHSITLPALRALREVHGRLDLLHFDAHPDLYPEFEGNRYSHATTFACALAEGLLQRVVQVGIRTANEAQRKTARQYDVTMIEMKDWNGPRVLSFAGPLYISIDLDAIDPAFAPGVSHPEPGGLSVRELLNTLARATGRVVGADLVEFNPAADIAEMTQGVAVKLLKELIGIMAAAEP